MHSPPSLAPLAFWSLPPSTWVGSPIASVLGIVAALAFSATFSALRSALLTSHPERVVARVPAGPRQVRVRQLLARADALASSAAILKIAMDVVAVVLFLGLLARDRPLGWPDLALTLGLGAPALLLFTESLPAALARARAGRLLARTLIAFHGFQLPVAGLVWLMDRVRRALLRLLGLSEGSHDSRIVIEGLRGVIEDAGVGHLDSTERELIENVIEFGDVDVAAVMTPRTSIHAVSLEAGLEGALAVFAEHGHSRIPIYGESIDSIIGTVTALSIVKALSEDRLASPALHELLRPAYLVPETKDLSELLSEFRAQKQKIAIVLDEYGGTAGLVTLGDVMGEIVGDMQDEHEEAPEPMRVRENGEVEVIAGLHVSEVNEALGLEIPEEQDYETLGGFVLSELGHFPKAGESFVHDDVRFAVLEASDRRVLRVCVAPPAN